MKRHIGWLLALLLAFGMTGFAEALPGWEAGGTYVASVSYNEAAYYAEAFEAMGLDASRMVYAEPPGGDLPAAWVLVDEDGPAAAAYMGHGVRLTVLETREDGELYVVVPQALEIIGVSAYGQVLAMDEASIEIDLMHGPDEWVNASPVRFVLTEDTALYFNVAVGLTAEVIVDADGVVLWAQQANG